MRGRTHARVQEAAAYEPVRRAGEGVESSNVEGIVPQAVGALNCVLLGDHNENRVISGGGACDRTIKICPRCAA
jgi:hypothetical protein